MSGKNFYLFVLLFICIIISGCCRHINETPSSAELNILFADPPGAPLLKAVNSSLAYYRSLPAKQRFTLCGDDVFAAEQIETLELFQDIVVQAKNADDFRHRIMARFSFCREPCSEEMLITGYYEPVFSGSLEKKAPYLYPLYSLPTELKEANGDRPYWARAEIETNNYSAGNELIYLADPLDAFLLHVQGSGRIRLPDGSIRLLRYAGNNGHPYRSIGKFLLEQGKLAEDNVDLPAIKTYLRNHPEELTEVLHHNERFIFFRMMKKEASDPQPPGSMGQPLTPGYSIALDQDYFATGALGLLITEQPVFAQKSAKPKWQPLCRFVFNQDSGSAIKGRNRADMFLGSGPYAEITAGIMKQPGKLYFLIRRKHETTGD